VGSGSGGVEGLQLLKQYILEINLNSKKIKS
jgi:hypothetical protein